MTEDNYKFINKDDNYKHIPRKYIYNENVNNSEYPFNINKVVFDLLDCGKENDRNKFDFLIEKLNKQYLGDEELTDEEYKETSSKNSKIHKKVPPTSYNNKNHFNLDMINQNKTGILDTNFIRTSSMQKQAHNLNTLKTNLDHDQSKYYGNRQTSSTKGNENLEKHYTCNTIHKKYTDVHANTKFYYPEDYHNDPYDKYSLDFDHSQWTDRANSSTYNNYYPNPYIMNNTIRSVYNMDDNDNSYSKTKFNRERERDYNKY